ncbi:MAG: AMMECR1 domain-containing protein [Armatimonadia bacterium]
MLMRLLAKAILGLVMLNGLSFAAFGQAVGRFEADRSGAGEFAVRLARRALDSYVLRRERVAVPEGVPEGVPELLRGRSGVFVSAMHDGAPRCCMGTLRGRRSIAEDIVEAATLGAAHDLRFPPIKAEELAGLQVIVSVLDPPEGITNPWVLDPVTEGLAVRSARRTGVVLPGETGVLGRFVQWGLIRAGACEGEKVEWFRVRAVRFLEGEAGTDTAGPGNG